MSDGRGLETLGRDAAAGELRKTGIPVVGDIPWGTHFSHFYETKDDLLDILVPYFKTGLENNEYCLWVVSDPLNEDEARGALKRAAPDADHYLRAGRIEIVPHTMFASPRQPPPGQIEILPHTEVYLQGGRFIAERVIATWMEKLGEALAKGHAGLRANGNEGWLSEDNWNAFMQYEASINEKLAGKRIIVLCSYPVSRLKAANVFDLVQTHQMAVLRRQGRWELLETREGMEARREIERLNVELEKRVVERTRDLATANEELKRENAERKRIEDALRQSEDQLRLVIDTIPTMAWTLGPDGALEFLNKRWLDYTGLRVDQALAQPTGTIHPDDLPRVMEDWRPRMEAGEAYEDEMRLRRADGAYRWFVVRTAPLRDGSGSIVKWYGVSMDIDDRKRAEDQLKAGSEQLRALSASVQSAREQESTRIAREIHDELGGALTSLRWDLEEVGELLGQSSDPARRAALRKRIETMTTLTGATLETVKRLASELRPVALDELGLVEAIEWQALQFHSRTGIPVQFVCSLEQVALNNEQSTAVFRILQEALTNILRHAQATEVTITMKQGSGEFFLGVQDNGRGITESETSAAHSLGLLGMRERAHLIGATLDVAGNKGHGTIVAVRLPISEASEHVRKS